MADITDPAARVWANEQIRPMAERLAKINVIIDDIIQNYNAVINATDTPFEVAVGADVLVDGQPASSTDLTKTDLQNFITQITTIQTQFDGGGVMDVILKPTVRSLSNIN